MLNILKTRLSVISSSFVAMFVTIEVYTTFLTLKTFFVPVGYNYLEQVNAICVHLFNQKQKLYAKIGLIYMYVAYNYRLYKCKFKYSF